MWTDYFDKVLLISLPKRANTRLKDATEELGRYEITFEVIEPVPCANPKESLFLTFVNIAKYYCDECERILIFEDDAKFLRDPGPVMDACITQLDSLLSWDIFYLGVNTHQPFDRFCRPNLLRIQHGYSTHAFALSQGGMQKVSDLEWEGSAIDVVLADRLQKLGDSFCAYPMLATQRDGYSDIDQELVTYGYIEERFNKHVAHLL